MKNDTEKAQLTALPHKTIVYGWDEDQKLIYVRTFDFENSEDEKRLALEAYEWCSQNCKGGYFISDTNIIDIVEKF